MRLASHKLPVATRVVVRERREGGGGWTSIRFARCPIPSSRGTRDAKQELWGARFALSTRQLKDYSTIPQTRERSLGS